jgi:hypothetical protein
MALSTTTNTISYVGDGVTTVFALPYLTFSTSHVFVSVNGNPVISGFTVSSLPAEGGNPNVTFTVAPAVGAVILLQRVVPETQTSVYTVAGPFPAKATEKNLDLLMMAVQQKTTQITNLSTLINTLPSASDPNNFGKGIKVKEDGTGYSTFLITPVGGGGGTVQPWGVHNLSLVSSVSAGAWTVAFKTQAGLDATLGDPIVVKFPTVGGGYTIQSITAPMSFTIPAGATIGSVNATTTRIYVGLALDGSTLRPFVYNPILRVFATATLLSINHQPLVESALYTLSIISPVAANAQTLWSNSNPVNCPIRIMGFVDSENATAGTWTAAGNPILKTSEVPDSGTLLRRSFLRDASPVSSGSVLPYDNTVPQSAEGLEMLAPTFVQMYKANPTIFNYSCNISANAICVASAAGFLDATASAFMANAVAIETADNTTMLSGSSTQMEISPGLHTFRVRLGSNNGALVMMNRTGALISGYFGGVAASSASVDELMV